MFTLYEYISNNSQCRKLSANDLLLTEYYSQAGENLWGLWSQQNCFAYVLEGQHVCETLDKLFLFQQGEAFFVKKGSHLVHLALTENARVLYTFLTDEFIKEVAAPIERELPSGNAEQTKQALSVSIIPIPVDELLSTCFLSIHTYFSQPSPPPRCLLTLKIKELILDLFYGKQNPSLMVYFKQLCSNARVSVANIMQANFTSHLPLAGFARLCGRSVSTFKRDFLKLYGMPPGKWLISKRLRYGKHLLDTTESDINEIAFKSGFETTSHFIRIFKQEYGSSPLRYRVEHTFNVSTSTWTS
jgi:AraC family transcriptional regulator, exoenzyme S synthesis regulatory protein ExsA